VSFEEHQFNFKVLFLQQQQQLTTTTTTTTTNNNNRLSDFLSPPSHSNLRASSSLQPASSLLFSGMEKNCEIFLSFLFSLFFLSFLFSPVATANSHSIRLALITLRLFDFGDEIKSVFFSFSFFIFHFSKFFRPR